MKLTGICLLSAVPMRAEPSERSEQVSQLLFGDTFAVLRRREQWLHIRAQADDYAGWVSANTVDLTPEDCPARPFRVVSVALAACEVQPAGRVMYLPGGSMFPDTRAGGDDTAPFLPFRAAGNTYLLDEKAVLPGGRDMAALAAQYLGAPYQWGGKTVFGMDCSALLQIAGRMAGIPLPRDARQQEQCGEPVAFEDAAEGDLVFFDNASRQVVHAGILRDRSSVIHASGCVRIDRFDREGIFHVSEKRYTHHLYSIKRLLSCGTVH
ncbi:MAG: C40 family peptidase [Bacteroidales bacterium]|nr:C40 family peptidase [Bacteroidales bacterium]